MLWRLRSTPDRTSCVQTLKLVQSFIDGRLERPTADRVASHLEQCRRCGLEAHTYRRIKKSLAGQGPVDQAALARLSAYADELAGGGTQASLDA